MRRRKGFTLVEIMIVVVIIGLLAAMAIPAFQKVRQSAIESQMDNDARQIAGACQSALLQDPTVASPIDLAYDLDTGVIGNAALQPYLRQVSKNYTTITAYDADVDAGVTSFTITHPRAAIGPRNYSTEGHHIPSS